ncbi:MAG: ABC transporter ATP-binding protein [Chloroflexi bacterium]|nr:ABC transporter ATP-binding protein [Chloroflexota bacterium]
MDSSPLLELRAVSKVYGGGWRKKHEAVVALDGLSFSLGDGRPTITAIAGESGSGKTTLAHLLLGHISPTSGQVLFRGRDVTNMTSRERLQFRREVQPIFQDPFAAFNPFYRIDHVLTMPIKRFKLADDGRAARRLIEEALEMVGLRPGETLGRFPHQLSGGQRQRIMVARALICRPRVILADEPVSMVDASLRATILASLQRLNRELGISVIYITHDLTTAYQICESIVVLYRGAVAEAGSVEQVIQQPKHPYTKLLVSSIPVPDRRRRWTGEDLPELDSPAPRVSHGCAFAPRCPSVMDGCWQHRPAFYRTDEHRVAACFLYQDRPVLETPDVADVFPTNATPAISSTGGAS